MFTATARVACAGFPCCKDFPVVRLLGPVSGFTARKQSFKAHHVLALNSSAASSTSRTTTMSSLNVTDASGPSSTMAKFKWSGGVDQVLHCSVDAAWALWADFLALDSWAPGSISLCEQIKVEEGYAANAVGCVRYCVGSEGTWVNERLLDLDPAKRYLSYRMEDNHFVFPQGFQNYIATVQLEDAGEGKTRVKWTYEVDPVATQTKESLTSFMIDFYTSHLKFLEVGANKLVAEAAAERPRSGEFQQEHITKEVKAVAGGSL